MTPESFDRYQIIRKLAGGGMGRVYLAKNKETGQMVALKLIDQGTDPDSVEVIEAEQRGAELQVRLSCIDTRVARIFDAGERNGDFFIAMEYIEGRDLSELLAEGPIEPRMAAGIAREICSVLANAHEFRAQIGEQHYQGIVHGDIKPRNIRITQAGEVKLLDFGIAKALSLTRKVTQNQFGSIPYSSPERLTQGEVDASSDLWSVGVVLFEMVSGHRLFAADSASRTEHAIRNYHALPASIGELPPVIREITARALDPRPERRYLTAAAFREDLQAFLQGHSLSAGIAEDGEATRRTGRDQPPAVPVQNEEDATRRTTPAANAVRTLHGGPPPLPLQTKTVKPIWQRAVAWGGLTLLLLVLIVMGLILNAVRSWNQGHDLDRDLATERVTNLDNAWKRYENISNHTYLPVVLTSPRNALKEKFDAVADRVINDFRENDTIIVHERDWQRAQSALARALELDPNDKVTKAKLRLCEAHLDRIRARSTPALNDAKAKFEEAASLWPKAPDPHIGMARLYAYGFRDASRTEQELREAENRNYQLSRRDKMTLADSMRDRADQWIREAGKVKGMPQESEYWERANADYDKAERIYQDLAPYGDANSALKRVLASKTALSQRMQDASQQSGSAQN